MNETTTTTTDTAPDFSIPRYKSALEPATPFTPEQLAKRYRQTASIGYVEELVKDRIAKTRHDLTHLVDKVVDIVYEAVGKGFTAHKEKIADLSARVQQLEAQLARSEKAVSNVRWSGVFHESASYHEGELTTDRGALWLARTATSERPGSSSAWVLICKSGSHGRDR
jgi:hypothetical protein